MKPTQTYSEFRKVQKEWKDKVENGEATKEEAIHAILDAAIQTLNDLKVDDQSWEIEEYGYMAKTIN